MRLRVLIFAVALSSTAPALAQKSGPLSSRALPSISSLGRVVAADPQRQVLALPVIEYSNTEGSASLPRGIIAGHQIARGTVLGVGIFERERKMRGYVGDVPQNMAPRKTKQAAVGLSMKF